MANLIKGDYGYKIFLEVQENETGFELSEADITFKAIGINTGTIYEGQAEYEETDVFSYTIQEGDFEVRDIYTLRLIFEIEGVKLTGEFGNLNVKQ